MDKKAKAVLIEARRKLWEAVRTLRRVTKMVDRHANRVSTLLRKHGVYTQGKRK